MEQKSIKKNIIYNTFRQLVIICFPILTYSYASRILGVQGIGVAEFTRSIVNYFILFAGLGIANYAIREGARIRENPQNAGIFISELFTINCLSTIVSLVLYLLLINIPYFQEYRIYLLAFSAMIPLSTLGIEWVFGIFEEYGFIALQTTIAQIISLIFLFIFVKDESNILEYILVLIVSNCGANFINYLYSRKFVKIVPVFSYKKLKRHFIPIFTMFGMTVATLVYGYMDVTMVGFISGDNAVGLYSTANRVVIVIVTLFASVRTVLLPRLSNYLGNDREDDFFHLNTLTIELLLILAVPMSFGLFCTSKELVLLLSGSEFINSAVTLKIFSLDILLASLNGFLVHQIFIPLKKEKQGLYATIIGAVVNLIANTFLIPLLNENGAAIGTCLAELALFIYALSKGNQFIHLERHLKLFMQCLICSFSIPLICLLINRFFDQNNIVLILSIKVICCIMIYFLLLGFFRYKTIKQFLKSKNL